MFQWHKKEKPFLGLAGMGGGIVSKLISGGGGAVFSGTGGVVSNGVEPGNGYRYHYFKDPGNFIVDPLYGDTVTPTIDILLVAGGGGGGSRSGGGGGAGGIAWAQVIPIPRTVAGQSIPITVGQGGPGGGSTPGPGTTGGDSYFGDVSDPYYFIAKGGGYGAADGPVTGDVGGCGGGGHYGPPDPGTGGPGIQPIQNPGKPWVTNYGGNGSIGAGAPNWQSGAGGGAGGPALDGDQNNRGAAGPGQVFPTFTVPLYMPAPDPYRPGINPLPGTYYGGGGGAGDYPPFISQRMPAGATWGGGGIGSAGTGDGTPGVNGLGGGGGGGSGSNNGPLGGNGGNGIVVIRYTV